MIYFSYNGEKYTDHPNSVNEHFQTSLGDIENKVFAVGGYQPDSIKVEVFDINSNAWTTKTSYPYCKSS